MEERISIIIPVYNVEPYLKRCLDSVCSQTYYNYECIIVNDGSADGSLRIAEEYRKKDKRFSVYSQENRGLSAARNFGIEKCKGEYLTFLDSDDMIHKDFLRHLYRRIKADGSQIAVCDYQKFEDEAFIKQNTQNKSRYKVIGPEQGVREVLRERRRYMISAWGKLYHRSLFAAIRYPEGRIHEDEFITYRLYSRSKKISVSNARLYYYYQRSGSIMGTYNIKRLDILEAFYDSILYTKKTMPELFPAAYANFLFNITIAYFRVSKLPGSKKIRKKLCSEFRLYYKRYQKLEKKDCTLLKSLAMYVFRISPLLYCKGAEYYLIRNEDE